MNIGSLLLVVLVSSGESSGSPLDVNPGLMLWTIITVFLLFLVLSKLAWKPILKSLNERENLIKESLEKAENARKEAEKLIAENKINLQKAEAEAKKIVDQSKEYAEKLKAQILEESKLQAKKMIDDAQKEIERKQAEAFMKLKEQIADIAISASEKILRENLDKEKQIRIVSKYLDDLRSN